MLRTIRTFAFIAVLTGLVMAVALAVARHGYGFGRIGVRRLDDIAGSVSFMPLAAIYFFAVAAVMLLPLRAAAVAIAGGVDAVHGAVVVLFGAIVGCLLAKVAFGQTSALRELEDWQYIFVAAIVGCHLLLDTMRRSVLVRSLSFVASLAASCASLFWTFRF